MERLSDRAIEIINELHTERLDYNSEYLPLIDAANKLNELENILGGYDLDELRKIVELYRCAQIVLNPTPEDLEKFKAMKNTEPPNRLNPCAGKDITVPTITLTLEQLREMDGQPVWVKSLINDKPGEWCILRVVQMSKTWFLACSGSEQVFGDKDTYGETWLAFTYPPAHIDRINWKPCNTCKDDNCRTCLNSGVDSSGDPCYKCNYEDGPGQYEPANFCPECGRPLTNKAWDMLEKRLRG